MDWFQIGQGGRQGCILSLCLYNLHVEYLMWNARVNVAQAGKEIPGRNTSNLRYADDTSPMAESKEELKSLLMKVIEESTKAGLTFNIWKVKIMASGLITLWEIDGETMETVRDYFLGFWNHCRWWLQPWNLKMLAPWKKSYDQPRQHIKKWRNYFVNKGPSRQSYGFLNSHAWMWELDHKEGWVPRIDPFELRCWRRLLRVPWSARRSNLSVLKEISPEYSLEALLLKLQYFGYLIHRADSLENTLIPGKTDGRRRKGWQRMRWLDGINVTQWTWLWTTSERW